MDEYIIHDGKKVCRGSIVWYALCIEDKDIREKVFKNLKKRHKNVSEQKFIHEKKISNMYNFVSASFCWADTLEGHTYWQNISEEVKAKRLKLLSHPKIITHKEIISLLK
jgi:hypothetical protein